ncbi:hypothetical protein FUAX_28830 [Fulvitalea axinellae]|uniref:DUF420 domain-containing protein n=1 Tax=Fulvitalea axinellae TaxID=1182444 RepID=A0AAU9DBH0_9BACT|nr:hypothetical protein FUAX_28830 [Fulvitalea axinellae]
MNTTTTTIQTDKKSMAIITLLSVAVPLAVAFLIFNPTKIKASGSWVYMLPHLHGVVNAMTAFVLVWAVSAIKEGYVITHKNLMTVAFVLGGLFLVSYVIYHGSVESTKYGDIDGDGIVTATEIAKAGIWRTIYFVILGSHIILSAIVLPLVLTAYYFGWTNRPNKHRKIVRFAYPIWFYVSVSGVIVYWLIKPYYQF